MIVRGGTNRDLQDEDVQWRFRLPHFRLAKCLWHDQVKCGRAGLEYVQLCQYAGRGFFADALQHHRHEVTGALLLVHRRLAVSRAQRSSHVYTVCVSAIMGRSGSCWNIGTAGCGMLRRPAVCG